MTNSLPPRSRPVTAPGTASDCGTPTLTCTALTGARWGASSPDDREIRTGDVESATYADRLRGILALG